METKKTFFVYDSYIFAFKHFLSNIKAFVITCLTWLAVLLPIIAIIGFFAQSVLTAPIIIPDAGTYEIVLLYIMTHKIMLISLFFLMFLFATWMGLGIIRLSLKIYEGKKWDMQTLFPSPLLIIKAFIGMIFFVLIMILGFALFIIPGIYWIIRAHFFIFALVEGDGIFESFATSLRMTKGKEWCILGQVLVNSVLTRVCLFFSFMSLLSSTYLYKYLKENCESCTK